MSTKGNLWEAEFKIEGVHLPEDQIIVGNYLRFEKIPKEESRGMWLPARCFVKVRGLTKDVQSLAKRRLEDFLDFYSVIGAIAVKSMTFEGAVRVEGQIPEENGKVVDGLMSMTIRTAPSWGKEESRKKLNRSEALRQSIDLNSTRNSYLRIALDYHRYAGQADRQEDKLINCMIGLEALYLKEIQELSYRLSHRVASLLGDTDENRSLLLENVKKLYIKRSKVVHGEPVSLSPNDTKLAREYLRESIKRFLALSKSYSRKGIIDILDLAIVNSQKRREIQEKSKHLFWEK